MKEVKLLIGLVVVLCMANVAVSAVNAYDTFTYEPGEIVGQSTHALGFTGVWSGGGGNLNQCTVESASLVYPGADSAFQDNSGMYQVIVPNFDGGRTGRFFDTDPNGIFGEYINAQGTIGKPGQTIYISFLMRTSYTSPFYAFELKRGDLGDGGAVLYIGNDVSPTDLQVCAYRNRDTSAANLGHEFQWLGAATTDPELFVVRIDFGTTGDNVTVYRNPALDAEPVMAPHLVNTRFLDFDAITMAAWVGPGGRVAQFDELCVASTYFDAVRFYDYAARAQNVSPLDGAVDVQGGQSVDLNWQAGTGVTPTGYKVYFSSVLDDVLTADASAYQGTTTSASLPISSLGTDTIYYWSVTEVTEPNDIPGVVWMFETNKTFPAVVSQPVSQAVFAGENASFTFDVTSETPESYQWYDASGMLTDSGNVSGTQTATLLITGAQVVNEGDYYCEVTNNAGTISSNAANLQISRLVGYWNLDQSADPNMAWQDLSGTGNDLQPAYTVPSTFTWTEGADGSANGALVFDGQFALGTKKVDGTMNAIPVGDEDYSISAWIKPDEFYGRGIIGWGNYGNNYQVTAVKIDNPTTIWHYWWNADMGANPGYSMNDGNWHLVSITYDGSTSTRAVYIDGLVRNQDTPVNHQVQTSEHFMIGKTGWPDQMIELFDGAMDDARVYNYALTAVEVGQLYTDMAGGDVCVVPPAYDVTNDCKVNLDDLAALATGWLDCGLVPSCITAN